MPHAPGAPVIARLRIAAGEARVEVRNPAPRPPAKHAVADVDDGGSGIPGIRARVAHLGGSAEIGRRAEAWVVSVRVPVDGVSVAPVASPGASCPLRRDPRQGSGRPVGAG